MTIKNRKLKEALKEEGLENINLEKGNGYFWIWSDDEEMNLKITSLYSNSILVNSFKDQSIENWVKDIKELLEEIDN